MARMLVIMLGMMLVGCSGAAQSARRATGQREHCAYTPRYDLTSGAWKKMPHSALAAMEVVPVAATPLEEMSGEGLGKAVPRSVLQSVQAGASAAKGSGTGGAAGGMLVAAGPIVAAAGSVLLLCLTVSAAVDGAETPIDIADAFYGTHFGDVPGWVQGQHAETKAPRLRTGPASAPRMPSDASPSSQPGEEFQKTRGRSYVTYTKLNKVTHRNYAGRTSMAVDLTQSLEEQALLAVILRDTNHHIDEDAEPMGTAFDFGRVDVFDVGTALDCGNRYDDIAYWRIRGREQQLVDSLGGARSDTGKPYRTENAIRSVAKDNPWGRRFHDAATSRWGQRHAYTGH